MCVPGSQAPLGNPPCEAPLREFVAWYLSLAASCGPTREAELRHVRSQAELGTEGVWDTLHPIRHDIDQHLLVRVIPCARIAPVQRIINITTPDWIVVSVFQFLPHHVVALNLLWMAALL